MRERNQAYLGSSISPCLKWCSRNISPYCERCFGETGVTGNWRRDDEALACQCSDQKRFYIVQCNWSNTIRIDGEKTIVNQVDFDEALFRASFNVTILFNMPVTSPARFARLDLSCFLLIFVVLRP